MVCGLFCAQARALSGARSMIRPTSGRYSRGDTSPQRGSAPRTNHSTRTHPPGITAGLTPPTLPQGHTSSVRPPFFPRPRGLTADRDGAVAGSKPGALRGVPPCHHAAASRRRSHPAILSNSVFYGGRSAARHIARARPQRMMQYRILRGRPSMGSSCASRAARTGLAWARAPNEHPDISSGCG
ncbi:hypothetical protein C8Q77DRAFT_110333 [Trametes polyzona]|nr:hypothetical protein C8Q77DRAFT_110333 [Trametes polyzona]